MSIDVVVARYQEDISWLSGLPVHHCVHIYNKGSPIPGTPLLCAPPHPMESTRPSRVIIELPNVGREAHTYLSHVIRTFDTMTPNGVTVFCQGNISDHVSDRDSDVDAVTAMAEEALRCGYSTSRFRSHKNDVDWRHQPSELFRIAEWPAGTALSPNPDNQSFGAWFRQHIRPTLPSLDDLRWAVGAVFAIRNDRILSRQKQFYVDLLNSMGMTRNPETAHFLERSWWYVFACDDMTT